MMLNNKWNDLDVFYADVPHEVSDDPRRMAPLIQDWNNSNQAVSAHFKEGWQLLEQIDRILTNQNTASYTRISLLLSSVAIVASAGAIPVTIWAT